MPTGVHADLKMLVMAKLLEAHTDRWGKMLQAHIKRAAGASCQQAPAAVY